MMLEDSLLADLRNEFLSDNVMKWVERDVSKGLQAPDDSERYVVELENVEAEIARVVDAIAQVGLSSALQGKLSELEHCKTQIEGDISLTRRTVPFPNTCDIRGGLD